MRPLLTDLLYKAQEGKCFHCLGLMHRTNDSFSPWFGWTREHIFARANGGKGLANNVVLAHKTCNNRRGHRWPTDVEVVRTVRLYEQIDRVAFVNAAGKAKEFVDKIYGENTA